MQGYCPSRSAVAKFRAEAVYIEFMKQWNVGVYFSLRYFVQLFHGCFTKDSFFNFFMMGADLICQFLQVSGNSWGFGFCSYSC